jgi:hypothetical protein
VLLLRTWLSNLDAAALVLVVGRKVGLHLGRDCRQQIAQCILELLRAQQRG